MSCVDFEEREMQASVLSPAAGLFLDHFPALPEQSRQGRLDGLLRAGSARRHGMAGLPDAGEHPPRDRHRHGDGISLFRTDRAL